jgi:lipid II:glycine glycyltransferase (peptidoglycan interpeptide bridge formation enzyme)
MWRRKDSEDDIGSLRDLLKAMRSEYATGRGLLLRVLPNVFDDDPDAEAVCSTFREAGFGRKESPHQTLFLELQPTLEELRKGLHQKWRNCLNNAEKNDIGLRIGTDTQLFEEFRSVYGEMRARKAYAADIDIDKYTALQMRLPEAERPLIILGERDGKVVAGGVFSTLGDTGVYLLGATNEDGMKSKASYLIQWRIIQWLKEAGFRRYDLGGVDAVKTPTTYLFKARICGREPRVPARVGEFVACGSSISGLVVTSGEIARCWKGKVKRLIGRNARYADHQCG